jgi:hypothetical protein
VTRKPSKAKKPLSEKQRASDEALREKLRHPDMAEFDKLMERAFTGETKSITFAQIALAKGVHPSCRKTFVIRDR